MFKPIKNIIKKNELIKDKDYKMFLEIKKEWNKKIETNIKTNLKIYDYIEGNLLIKANTATWRNEASLIKSTIKKNY